MTTNDPTHQQLTFDLVREPYEELEARLQAILDANPWLEQPLASFPDTPPNSYVTEDGYLVVGDEAWLLPEWLNAAKATRP
jgi:hypothetical protein